MHLGSNVTLNSIVCILFLNSVLYVKCLQFSSSFTDVRMCSKENIWKFIVLPAQNCCKNSSCVFWILRLIVLLFSYKLFTITVSDIQRRIYFSRHRQSVCYKNFPFNTCYIYWRSRLRRLYRHLNSTTEQSICFNESPGFIWGR